MTTLRTHQENAWFMCGLLSKRYAKLAILNLDDHETYMKYARLVLNCCAVENRLRREMDGEKGHSI